MNTLSVVILIVVGVALFVVELFLIPGFGMAGVAGFLSMAAGVVCSYVYLGATAGHLALSGSVLLCAFAVYMFVRCRALDKMALRENINSKVDLMRDTNIEVGDTGVAVSRLAPMGKVRVGQAEVEAKSSDDFIDQGTQVQVQAIEGNKIIVKSI